MARLTGSTLRTVRFYEEAGLLIPDERRDGGHRMFRPGAVERLQLILDMREAGLSLGEIRELFELRGHQASAPEAGRALESALQEQARRMAGKIELLQRLHGELTQSADVLGARSGEASLEDEAPRAARLLWG